MDGKMGESVRRPATVRERLKEERRLVVRRLSPSERLMAALELSDLCRSLRESVRKTAS
jgi:hypothetical protein